MPSGSEMTKSFLRSPSTGDGTDFDDIAIERNPLIGTVEEFDDRNPRRANHLDRKRADGEEYDSARQHRSKPLVLLIDERFFETLPHPYYRRIARILLFGDFLLFVRLVQIAGQEHLFRLLSGRGAGSLLLALFGLFIDQRLSLGYRGFAAIVGYLMVGLNRKNLGKVVDLFVEIGDSRFR